jgi:uncharacterized protein YecE (DUF72 family)
VAQTCLLAALNRVMEEIQPLLPGSPCRLLPPTRRDWFRPGMAAARREPSLITSHESAQQLDLFESQPPGVQAVPWAEQSGHPLARPAPDGLYLGTSSWSFPGWEGLLFDGHYSEQRLADSGLAAYACCPMLRAVSLDKSYYRPPEEAEYRRLAAQVDDSFRFVVKAPRDLLVPHPTQGFNLEPLQRIFLRPASRGLGDKLGVVLLQFPPGSWKASGSPESFLEQLALLLAELPRSLYYSLELRDAQLLSPRLAQALEGSTVSLCASIHPRLPDPDRQLLTVPPTPGCPIVFRWNLRPSLQYKQAQEDLRPFNALRLPDPGRRELLAQLIARALKAGRKVYATANNKAEGCAPLSLSALLDEVLRVLEDEVGLLR